MKDELMKSDVRFQAFQKVARFVNYELVEGDIFEFGVYTGRSLALLQLAHEEYVNNCIHKINFSRDFIGFDSFKGLFKTDHPRWKDGLFSVNHSWHPTIGKGETVTKEKVEHFFDVLKLKSPTIVEGEFKKSLRSFLSKYQNKAAVIHIDSDTYESTKLILESMRPFFQDGTVLLFDDMFNYKGNPKKGEAGAFHDFQKKHKELQFVDYFNYATFCKAFIVVKK